MNIAPALYIVLGLSVGVGSTLIFLQEKIIRERRKLMALSASEKAKAKEALKELDSRWEQATAKQKKEIEEATLKIAALEKKEQDSEEKIVMLEEMIANHGKGAGRDEISGEIDELKRNLLEGEEKLQGLLKERVGLQGALAEARKEVSDLYGEIDFLKGAVAKLESERKKWKDGDDYLVVAPGRYIIPGSVARSLMGKKE